jgi:hypothetical protein
MEAADAAQAAGKHLEMTWTIILFVAAARERHVRSGGARLTVASNREKKEG